MAGTIGTNSTEIVAPVLTVKSCVHSAARLAVAVLLLQCPGIGMCQSMEFDTGPFKENLNDASPINPYSAKTMIDAASKRERNLPANSALSAAASPSTNLANNAVVVQPVTVSPSAAQSATARVTTESAAVLLAQSSQSGNRASSTTGASGATGSASAAVAGAASPERDFDSSTPEKNSVRTLLNDTIITTKIKAAMIADASVRGSQISVETAGGAVTLSGTAETALEITQAEKIAGNTVGVKAVVNKLTLKK